MQTVDLERMGLRAGERVLDIGCGEGRHAIAAYAAAPVTAIAVDVSLDQLKTSRRKLSPFLQPDHPARALGLAVADACALPFADGRFDRVICSEVLEHVPGYGQALREAARVLRPNGVLAVSVPRFFPEWVCWRLCDAYHTVAGGHLRIFKSKQLRAAAEGAGLTCYARHWAHALHVPYWWLQCLLWSRREQSALIAAYHRFLVWDLTARPWLTRVVEHLLNPLLGKSVVLYFVKDAATRAPAV